MKKNDPVTDAKRLLEENAKKRAQECAAELNDLLIKHNCTLSVAPNVKINGQDLQIIITPKS